MRVATLHQVPGTQSTDAHRQARRESLTRSPAAFRLLDVGPLCLRNRALRANVSGTLNVALNMNVLVWVTLLLALIQSVSAEEPLAGFADWLAAERERWQIPGMAVCIVQADEIRFCEGLGTTRLGTSEAVDEHTLFGIASLTKAFTATALGLLVDEGELDFDEPVIRHMPDFRLSDPWAGAQVSAADLLSHRVGLGRMLGNRLQFMTHRERSELIYRMRYHDFEQPFRQGYVYSNLMYLVAGELIPAITGQSWDGFVAERLFRPLDMARSNTSITALAGLDNIAWPHQEIDGEIMVIERRNFDNAGPAASINASVRELAEWLRLNLGEPGVIDQQRLVSPEVMARIHAPANLIGFDSNDETILAYGLGWSLTRYADRHVLQHGGATDGMNSVIALVPSLDLGLVMTANLFTHLRTAVVREVIDRHLGKPDADWGGHYFERFGELRAEARQARLELEAERQADTVSRFSPEMLAGRYHHPLYDVVEVFPAADGLALRFWDDDSQVADLEHWHHNTFRAHWRNQAQRSKFVWFSADRDGRPVELNVEFTLRPLVLEEGIYPADYTRLVRFRRAADEP